MAPKQAKLGYVKPSQRTLGCVAHIFVLEIALRLMSDIVIAISLLAPEVPKHLPNNPN
jgi:hypothetical protein